MLSLIFATLRSPSFAAPLWRWYIIGVVYYATFFFILYRILKLNTDSILKPATLSLIVFMMVVNALWNYVFFRARKLFLAFVAGSAAPVFDAALFICLVGLDGVAAWSLVTYLLYRVYAVYRGAVEAKQGLGQSDQANQIRRPRQSSNPLTEHYPFVSPA